MKYRPQKTQNRKNQKKQRDEKYKIDNNRRKNQEFTEA